MACVVVHPLQSLPGHPRYALDPAQAFGTRTPRSDYLHGDTIFYVSRIIMNDFSEGLFGGISRGLQVDCLSILRAQSPSRRASIPAIKIGYG